MWRALFLAIGITFCTLGVEAMAIDKAVLRDGSRFPPNVALGIQQSNQLGRVELVPPKWAPWGLVSAGVVTLLYSFTIPRRVRG